MPFATASIELSWLWVRRRAEEVVCRAVHVAQQVNGVESPESESSSVNANRLPARIAQAVRRCGRHDHEGSVGGLRRDHRDGEHLDGVGRAPLQVEVAAGADAGGVESAVAEQVVHLAVRAALDEHDVDAHQHADACEQPRVLLVRAVRRLHRCDGDAERARRPGGGFGGRVLVRRAQVDLDLPVGARRAAERAQDEGTEGGGARDRGRAHHAAQSCQVPARCARDRAPGTTAVVPPR